MTLVKGSTDFFFFYPSFVSLIALLCEVLSEVFQNAQRNVMECCIDSLNEMIMIVIIISICSSIYIALTKFIN